MQLQIDAWLERRDPLIRVVDTETGRELLRWDSERVRELIDSGEVWVHDLGDEALACGERLGLL